MDKKGLGWKIGLFISDDELSKYVYKKLKGKGINIFPISFVHCGFVKSCIFHPGDITGVLSYLRKEGINTLVFIGKIPAEAIFKKMHPSSDILFERKMPWSGEVVLKNLTSFLKKADIEVKPLTEVLKDELAEEKLYTEIPLSKDEMEDVKRGVSLLDDIAKYRVGQSVAVKKGMLVAIEGIEGTDEMIRRAGRYCKNFIVVKMAGRYKDKRFDIPVIGPDTIEILIEAGARAIAVEAGKSIIFNCPQVVSMCNRKGLTLVGLKSKFKRQK
ncbi:MAG: UDP-2,3-diacylglucosamine diphosphatase LpxI [Candidatus Ratteibacteria bacterium]|nr:UDP-2,3-diacylglucosamine diphosphatase LpxI [Candidatus Ratteibacteria bacterium]